MWRRGASVETASPPPGSISDLSDGPFGGPRVPPHFGKDSLLGPQSVATVTLSLSLPFAIGCPESHAIDDPIDGADQSGPTDDVAECYRNEVMDDAGDRDRRDVEPGR